MMKAGSAGSTPDGATKTRDPISHPFSVLLNDVGDAVSSLNTLVVGLDAVEKGHKKPDALDISWNPSDRIIAARKSRKFVLEAIIVRVSEGLLEFINALGKLPRLKAVSSKWDVNTKNAIKVNDVFTAFLGDNYLVPAAVLVVHWRNRIVHRGSNAKLKQNQKQALQSHETEIAENYKGLSVDCLLCHFEEKRPTLKDVSSLIAICINLGRHIDKTLHMNLSKPDLDAWLEHYGLTPMINRVKAETKPEKRDASIRRIFQAQAPLLFEPYIKYQTTAQ
jgi:hypothetical protein